MSASTICELCGHANPAQATFCESCKAFFWEARPAAPTARTSVPEDVPPVEARPVDVAVDHVADVSDIADPTDPAAPTDLSDVASRTPRNEPPGGVRRREAPRVAPTRRVAPSVARLAPRRVGEAAPNAIPGNSHDAEGAIRAVMPGTADDRTPEPVSARATEQRRLDDQMCAVCGAFSRAARRFCRCGAVLREQPPAPPAVPPSAGPLPRGNRGFRRAMKATGAPRPRWSAPLEPSVVGVRAGTGVLAVVALVLGFAAQAAPMRRTGLERLRQLVGAPWTAVPVSAVAVSPAKGEDPRAPAAFATDGRPRAWVAPWPADAPPGAAPCIPVAGTATLVVGFAKSTAIGRVVVTQAKPSGASASAALPTAVDVAFSDGSCTRVALQPGQATGSATVRAHGITQARVTVASVASGAGTSTTVALGDVAFQKR